MLVGGTGAVLGPVAVSLLMRQMGPVGFFACVAAVHTAIGVFALYRMTRRAPLPLEEQSASVPVTSTRSEEHTSELQSLMRISYAVFCLKNTMNSSTTASINALIPETLRSPHIASNRSPDSSTQLK